MSDASDESRLRQEFQRLRQEDEAQVREFPAIERALRQQLETAPAPRGQRLAGAASPRHWRRGPWRRPLAAALAVLVIAGGAALLRRLRSADAPPDTVVLRLSQWRSPTDSLLPARADRLLRGVPRLDESVLGGNFTIGGQEKP